MPAVEWTDEHQRQAMAEGWMIYGYSSNGPDINLLKRYAMTGPHLFPDDRHVWRFVREMSRVEYTTGAKDVAIAGLHHLAICYLAEQNPKHRDEVNDEWKRWRESQDASE